MEDVWDVWEEISDVELALLSLSLSPLLMLARP
jgi:hypothetical protein